MYTQINPFDHLANNISRTYGSSFNFDKQVAGPMRASLAETGTAKYKDKNVDITIIDIRKA